MWVYRFGEQESNPVILYEYQNIWKKGTFPGVPERLQWGCVTDDYQVYHSISGGWEDLTIVGCCSYARRGFADVVKIAGKKIGTSGNPLPIKAFSFIQKISRYDDKIASMEPVGRLEACILYVL